MPAAAPPSAQLTARARSYLVTDGSSLWRIARQVYGRARLWTLIREANPDKVRAADQMIRAGETLAIPPPP